MAAADGRSTWSLDVSGGTCTVIALEVSLNGERLCVAGAEELSVLTAALSFTGALGPRVVEPPAFGESAAAAAVESTDSHLHIGGLTCRGPGIPDHHLRWRGDVNVAVGDTVTIRILNAELAEIDPPDRENPAQDPTFDSSERRMFDLAKETYLQLKGKYEPADI
jgi:hypothetical protein